MNILGIESSCDDTGIAIYHPQKGVRAHVLSSQHTLHAPFGGVVPELASRNHIAQCVPLLSQALAQAQLTLQDLHAIAYTRGPGLIGALLTGASFAKSLAFSLGIPALGVHHLEAHLLVTLLETPVPQFPFLALLVSGGHTALIEARALGDYHLLGDTLDDAVGEAFDKTAKILGLPYPGGPQLAALAATYPADKPLPFPPFPRPLLKQKGFQFSFSGLKTHARLTWQESAQDTKAQQVIAFAFQSAAIDVLTQKCQRALRHTGHRQLVVAGGVSANLALRQALHALTAPLDCQVTFPNLAYCTDNGLMIAVAGFHYLMQGKQDDTLAINVHPRWPLHQV